MNAVTVSSKYQVVIPKGIRDAFKIKPGTKMAVVPFGETIHLVRIRPIKELRGILKGMDTTIEKEPDRL